MDIGINVKEGQADVIEKIYTTDELDGNIYVNDGASVTKVNAEINLEAIKEMESRYFTSEDIPADTAE